MTTSIHTGPDVPAGTTNRQPIVDRPEATPAAGDHPEPSVDLADQIVRLVRGWSYLKAKMVSTVDPEISSLFLIGRLVKDGPTRAKDLAGAICADQSTVSRQVAALVKAELIERLADPDDGRASLLMPTALGVAKLERHFANRGRALAPLMADWSVEERRQFVELLDRFTTSLESRRDEVASTMARSHSESADRRDVPPTASTERSH